MMNIMQYHGHIHERFKLPICTYLYFKFDIPNTYVHTTVQMFIFLVFCILFIFYCCTLISFCFFFLNYIFYLLCAFVDRTAEYMTGKGGKKGNDMQQMVVGLNRTHGRCQGLSLLNMERTLYQT